MSEDLNFLNQGTGRSANPECACVLPSLMPGSYWRIQMSASRCEQFLGGRSRVAISGHILTPKLDDSIVIPGFNTKPE